MITNCQDDFEESNQLKKYNTDYGLLINQDSEYPFNPDPEDGFNWSNDQFNQQRGNPEDPEGVTQRLNEIADKVPKIKKRISKKSEQEEMEHNIQKDKIKEIYMLPGESKNIPKNFTRALKCFILNHITQDCQQNTDIKKFLATKPEKSCKQTLENSIKSSQVLKSISQVFFGRLQWSRIFLEENKVDLEPYFRFNQMWFKSKQSQD